MHAREDLAKAKWLKSEYKGKTYYFCSKECKDEFEKDTERYVKE
jgi:YHS domain-containing protein